MCFSFVLNVIPLTDIEGQSLKYWLLSQLVSPAEDLPLRVSIRHSNLFPGGLVPMNIAARIINACHKDYAARSFLSLRMLQLEGIR